MRLLKRLLLGLLAVVGLLLVLAVAGTLVPHPAIFAQDDTAPASRHILVVANTLHTDIAIPIDAQSLATFGFLADAVPIGHPNARWLLMGWGGRSFYLETPTLADIRPGPTFRALTVDSSVMHVDVLGEIVPGSPAVTDLAITEAAYANLLAEISASFARKDGAVQPINGFAFSSTDKFFEAVGSFNALLGCNVWTSRMLRSAGIRTGLWNPIPPSLTTSLALFNPGPTPPSR